MSAPDHPDWNTAGAHWPNRAHSRFIEAEMIRWHVQTAGTHGPLVLLLHGAGAATHTWRDILPALAEHCRIIAPDLPGHGFTRVATPRALSLPGMASAVAGLIGTFGQRPDLVVGHSAGAAIALRCVLDGTIETDGIVGLNAALTPFRGLSGMVFPPLAKMLALNPVTPWIFSSMAGTRAQAERLIAGTGSAIDARGLACYHTLLARPDHVGNALSMMALWDLDPLLADLGDLATPTHLIVGSNDRTVAPQEAEALAARHAAITVERIDGFGHLMHEEDPGLAVSMIRRLAAAGAPAPDPVS